MLDATRNFVKDVDEIKEYVFKQVGPEGIVNMSVEDFGVMKAFLTLIDDYNEILTRQAEIIENQNSKINEILREVKRIKNKE